MNSNIAVMAPLSDGNEQNISDDPALNWVCDTADVLALNNEAADNEAADNEAADNEAADNQVQAVGVYVTGTADILAASWRPPEGPPLQDRDNTTLNIGDAVVVPGSALGITPFLSRGLPAGFSKQYQAKALYTDGQWKEVTTAATTEWSSADTTIASVDNASGKGKVIANVIGQTTISASYVDPSDTTNEVHAASVPLRVIDGAITQLEMMQSCELAALSISSRKIRVCGGVTLAKLASPIPIWP